MVVGEVAFPTMGETQSTVCAGRGEIKLKRRQKKARVFGKRGEYVIYKTSKRSQGINIAKKCIPANPPHKKRPMQEWRGDLPRRDWAISLCPSAREQGTHAR
jgi:hypothetical protein